MGIFRLEDFAGKYVSQLATHIWQVISKGTLLYVLVQDVKLVVLTSEYVIAIGIGCTAEQRRIPYKYLTASTNV